MPVYTAMPLTIESEKTLEAAVLEKFDDHNRYKLIDGKTWFLKYDGTTVELSNFLEITGQPKGESSPIGSVVIIPIAAYYGRGPSDMWEWLKIRLEND